MQLKQIGQSYRNTATLYITQVCLGNPHLLCQPCLCQIFCGTQQTDSAANKFNFLLQFPITAFRATCDKFF